LPNGLTSIGNDTFIGCSSLQHLTIPATVTTAYSTSLRIGSANNLATIIILRPKGTESLMSIANGNVFEKK
jgi:hypothetical protein